MPTQISLEKLQEANDILADARFTKKQVEALKKAGPMAGWRNAMHMLVYGKTPEEIKAGKTRR